MNGRGEDIVAGLPHIDVVIRVNRRLRSDLATEGRDGQVADDLVGVHVAARSGAGLEHIHGKVVVECPRDHAIGPTDDGLGELGRQLAEIAVDLGRGLLDVSESPDHFPADGSAGYREVLLGPGGLGAVQAIRRHREGAHGVLFETGGHGGLLLWLRTAWPRPSCRAERAP